MEEPLNPRFNNTMGPILSYIHWCVLLLLCGCMVNPFAKQDFDQFYNESTSLVGNLIFYHFNETSYSGNTGDIVDDSGRDRHSTSTGSLSKEQGIFGDGIACQGSSGVNLEVDEFDLSFDERTISIWFVSFDNSDIRYIYEEGGTVNGINIYMVDGLLYGHTYKANGADFQVWHNYTVSTDTWYHVVISFHKDDGFLMYINGEKTGAALPLGFEMPSHGNANALCYMNDDTRRHDGSEANNTGAHAFNGVLDEMAVWNRTLSDEEIRNLYLRQGRL